MIRMDVKCTLKTSFIFVSYLVEYGLYIIFPCGIQCSILNLIVPLNGNRILNDAAASANCTVSNTTATTFITFMISSAFLTQVFSSTVRSFGTEDRPTEMPVAARDEVYEYIIFRGTDIKKIEVCDTPKQPTLPGGLHNDPAIVQVRASVVP